MAPLKKNFKSKWQRKSSFLNYTTNSKPSVLQTVWFQQTHHLSSHTPLSVIDNHYKTIYEPVRRDYSSCRVKQTHQIPLDSLCGGSRISLMPKHNISQILHGSEKELGHKAECPLGPPPQIHAKSANAW